MNGFLRGGNGWIQRIQRIRSCFDFPLIGFAIVIIIFISDILEAVTIGIRVLRSGHHGIIHTTSEFAVHQFLGTEVVFARSSFSGHRFKSLNFRLDSLRFSGLHRNTGEFSRCFQELDFGTPHLFDVESLGTGFFPTRVQARPQINNDLGPIIVKQIVLFFKDDVNVCILVFGVMQRHLKFIGHVFQQINHIEVARGNRVVFTHIH